MMKLSNILFLMCLVSTLIACGGAEERKSVYLEKAKRSLEIGDYEKARVELKNVLQIDPKDARAYFQIGTVYELKKDYRKSFMNYNKAAELDPENPEYLAKIGSFYLVLADDIEKATDKMNESLAKDKNNKHGLLLKAGILLKQDKPEEAKVIVKTLYDGKPAHVESALFLARLYVKEKEYVDAISVLDKTVGFNPENQKLLRTLANTLFLNKNYDRSRELWVKIKNDHPDVYANHLALSLFYQKTGESKKAEEVLRAAVAANEDDVQRKLRLVDFIRQTKNSDAAITELESQIKNNSKESSLRLGLAQLQLATNDIDGAISTYKMAVEDFSDGETGITSRVQLAKIYMQRKDVKSAILVLGEAAEITPNDSEVNLVQAKIALYNKNVEQAIISLRTVIKNNPDNVEAYFLLAASHKMNNENSQAKDTIVRAYENNRDNIKVLMTLAKYHAQNKNYAESEKIIDSYLRLDPNNYEALSIKSSILNGRNDYSNASELTEILVSLYPNKENGYIQSIPAMLSNKKIDGAIDLLNTGYQKTTSIQILKLKSEIQIASGKADDVITSLKAIDPEKESETVALLLAKAYMVNKDNGSSKKVLLDSIKQDKTRVQSYIALAGLYSIEKNTGQTITVLRDGINANPDNAKLSITLAGFYEKNGDTDSVISVLRDGIKANPDDKQLSTALAVIYRNNGDTDNAISVLLNAIRTNPNDVNSSMMLAGIYEKSGNVEKAIQQYETILSNNPDNLVSVNNLASLLSDHRKDQDSLNRAKKLADKLKDIKQPVILDTVGWVYYKTGNYSDAVSTLKAAIKDAPDNYIFNYHLGMAYYKDNNKKLAKVHLSKALEEKADFTGRSEAEELLKTL